jgi:hypothetical protein
LAATMEQVYGPIAPDRWMTYYGFVYMPAESD